MGNISQKKIRMIRKIYYLAMFLILAIILYKVADAALYPERFYDQVGGSVYAPLVFFIWIFVYTSGDFLFPLAASWKTPLERRNRWHRIGIYLLGAVLQTLVFMGMSWFLQLINFESSTLNGNEVQFWLVPLIVYSIILYGGWYWMYHYAKRHYPLKADKENPGFFFHY